MGMEPVKYGSVFMYKTLDVSYVMMDRAQLKVVKGKDSKDRIVAIPKVVLHLL